MLKLICGFSLHVMIVVKVLIPALKFLGQSHIFYSYANAFNTEFLRAVGFRRDARCMGRRCGCIYMGNLGVLPLCNLKTAIFIALLCIGSQSRIWFRKGIATLKASL